MDSITINRKQAMVILRKDKLAKQSNITNPAKIIGYVNLSNGCKLKADVEGKTKIYVILGYKKDGTDIKEIMREFGLSNELFKVFINQESILESLNIKPAMKFYFDNVNMVQANMGKVITLEAFPINEENVVMLGHPDVILKNKK